MSPKSSECRLFFRVSLCSIPKDNVAGIPAFYANTSYLLFKSSCLTWKPIQELCGCVGIHSIKKLNNLKSIKLGYYPIRIAIILVSYLISTK